jgi:hypothetical protein
MPHDSDLGPINSTYLKAISFSDGGTVIAAPTIEADWNLKVRDYEDRVFRWRHSIGLEPDPNWGYQLSLATHYQIEITPDLGWSNIEAMFEPYIDNAMGLGNARLTVISRISDFVEVGDETVEYSIPLDTMKKILAPGFKRYLWRVRAIATSGALGDPSSIQVFRGRVTIPSTEWSVNKLPATSKGLSIILSGTKTSAVAQIEINDVTSQADFPSDTTWTAEVALSSGRNVFDIRAIDSQGNTSEYRRVETEVTSETADVFSYYNRFDDFGFLMDIPRLKGEKNPAYRDRIKDVMVHRAHCRYPGLMNGILRELDLEYEDQAVYIQPDIDPDTQQAWRDLTCWLDTEGFHIASPRYVRYQEYHTANPHLQGFSLSDLKPFSALKLEQPIGTPIPDEEYDINDDGDIIFRDQKYLSAPTYATYSYILTTTVVGKTVEELVDDINSLTYQDIQQVSATIKAGFDDSQAASGLQRFPPLTLDMGTYTTVGEVEVEGKYPIRWAAIELYPIMDKGFKDRYINIYGSRFGTEYDTWAMSLKSKMHTTWGYLVADENVWSHPEIRVSGIGTLETIYDAHKGSWVSSSSGEAYTTRLARAMRFRDLSDESVLGLIGIPWTWFKSGIGDGHDLYVSMTESQGDIDQPVEEGYTIVQTAEDQEVTNSDPGIGAVAVDSVSEIT